MKKIRFWRYIILLFVLLFWFSFYFQYSDFNFQNSWTITDKFKNEYISYWLNIDNWFVVVYDKKCIDFWYCNLNHIHKWLFEKYDLNKYWITYLNQDNKYFNKFLKKTNLDNNITFPFLLIHEKVFKENIKELKENNLWNNVLEYKLWILNFNKWYWKYYWYSLWKWKLDWKNICFENDYQTNEDCSNITLIWKENFDKEIKKLKQIFDLWFHYEIKEKVDENKQWLLLSTKNKNVLNLFLSNFKFKKITNEDYLFNIDEILNSNLLDNNIEEIKELENQEIKNQLDVYVKLWDEFSNSLLYHIFYFYKINNNYNILIHYFINEDKTNLEETIFDYCIQDTFWKKKLLEKYSQYFLKKDFQIKIDTENTKFQSCINSLKVKDDLINKSKEIEKIWNKIIPFSILNNKYLINWWIISLNKWMWLVKN